MATLHRRGGAGGPGGGGNANVGALLRQAGEDDKGLFLSARGADLTWHLRATAKGDTLPAIGGHADLELISGVPGQTGHLRVQFPADVADFEGPDSNNLVVRLFRNDGQGTTAPAVSYFTGVLFITLGPQTTAAQVRTALDGFSTFTVTTSIIGNRPATDTFVLAGSNFGQLDYQVRGGRGEIEPGIELLAQPDDGVNGPNILVKYDEDEDNTLQLLLDALEENDQGVTITVVYGTDLTAAPEDSPFVRSFFDGGLAEAPTTGTGGITEGQAEGIVRRLTKGYALTGGPDVPDNEIASSIARDDEIKDYARVGGGQVLLDDIPAGIARDSEIKGYARAGGGQVPDSDIPGGITRDTEVTSILSGVSSQALSTGQNDEVFFAGPGGNVHKATTQVFRQLFKSYVGTWPVTPGFIFRVGDLTDHNGRAYFVNTQHTVNAASGPETNAHYTPLGSWVGAITAGWYRAGSIGSRSGGIWIAWVDVVNSDPLPGAATNVKWIRVSDNPASLDWEGEWTQIGGGFYEVNEVVYHAATPSGDEPNYGIYVCRARHERASSPTPGTSATANSIWFRIGWHSGAVSSIVDVDFDAGTGELVSTTRGGATNRKAIPTGGTVVAANPDGTDGDQISRIAVAGVNYNFPRTGYIFYVRPTLTQPTDVNTDTAVNAAGHTVRVLDEESIDGPIYAGVDFSTEWFGYVDIGATWTGGGNNEVQTVEVDLVSTHEFGGKMFSVTRSTFRPMRKGARVHVDLSNFDRISSVMVGTYRPQGGNVDGSDDIEITAEDLAAASMITYEFVVKLIRNGNAIAFTLQALEWGPIQTRSYQIAHGTGGEIQPPSVRPSISSYTLRTGEQHPVAGSIAGDRYQLDWQIAQADHVGSARILGFKEAYGDGTGAAVLDNISPGASVPGHPNVGWANGQGSVLIPQGVSLADGEHYTLRLQVFGEGVTNPALTATPAAYQDIVIVAHAPATAAYHWGRLPRIANKTAAQYAADIVFGTTGAGTDLVTGNALDTTNGYDAVPDSTGNWIFYLAARADEQQPSGWTTGGLAASAVFQSAVTQAFSSVDYSVYVMQDLYYRTHSDGSQNYTPTVS